MLRRPLSAVPARAFLASHRVAPAPRAAPFLSLLALVAAGGCGGSSEDEPVTGSGLGGSGGQEVELDPTAGSPGSRDGDDTGGAAGSESIGGSGSGNGFGDTGTPCDPASNFTGCTFGCVPLSDGSGVCTIQCSTNGSECPDGYQCSTLPIEGTSYQLCLPNVSCGSLDYRGECQGSVLRYCGIEGPVSADCAALTGGNGAPMQCSLVAEDIGYDCVSSAFTPGCGQLTSSGSCAGDVLSFCSESSEVTTVDCSQSALECVVAADGIASCALPGAAGCGVITYQGECSGATLQYCLDSNVVLLDCAMSGRECGFVDDMIGFDCVSAAGVSTGAQRISGAFAFEKPALTPNGLGAIGTAPVRRALVRLLRASDQLEIARSFTEPDGFFEILFDEQADVLLQITAVGRPETYPFSVQTCPLGNCAPAVHGVLTTAFTPALDLDLGVLLISVADGEAGAFNIFDQLVKGADFALQNFGRVVPPHVAQWESGSNTSCNTSCFSPRTNTILVHGTLQDSDEFDDPVLLHEYGHFLENAFSRSSSPGGAHDGSPADPRLAWGEGYGTYAGATISGSSLYIDTFASGASVIDISNTGSPYALATQGALTGMNQLVSEFLTAEVLWQITSGAPGGAAGKGTAPVFDVLGGYFPAAAFADRGVSGVDLVDFLDGWFCRGHADQAFIQGIVNVGHRFPYDYASLPSCP